MKKQALCIVLCLLTIMCFVGCTSEPTSGPGDVAASFLQAWQHQEYASIKQYYAENVDNLSNFKNKVESISPHVANEVFKKMGDFSYTIEQVSIDSNDDTKATVTVTLRCYDLGEAFESIILDYLETDLTMTFNGAKDEDIVKEAETVIMEKVDSAKQTYIQTTPIALTLEDNTWKVNKLEENPDLMNALSGNILYTIRDLSESLK